MRYLRTTTVALLCRAMLVLTAPGPEKAGIVSSNAPISVDVETTLSPGPHKAFFYISNSYMASMGEFTVPECPTNNVPVLNITLYSPRAGPGTMVVYFGEDPVYEYTLEVSTSARGSSVGINSKDTVSAYCREKGKTPTFSPTCKSHPAMIRCSYVLMLVVHRSYSFAKRLPIQVSLLGKQPATSE